MTVANAGPTNCARCGEPCDAQDLVCNRCSETRVRAALPRSDAPPEDQGDAALDTRLARIEQLANEKADRLVLSIDGSLAGESSLVMSVVTAPAGPVTPPEDVWAEPIVLATFECATAEVVAARVQMATRLSAERNLHPPEVRRHLRVGTRGFLGDAAAAGMLLDARLHMARLALAPKQPHSARIDDTGGTVHVLVEFDGSTMVELFSEASPGDALRASLVTWVAAFVPPPP